jgi:hypothetical protein
MIEPKDALRVMQKSYEQHLSQIENAGCAKGAVNIHVPPWRHPFSRVWRSRLAQIDPTVVDGASRF